MMKLSLLLPLMAGLAVVLQNGINEKVSNDLRLGSVLIANNIVCTLFVVLAAYLIGGAFGVRSQDFRGMSPSMILSGFCGFLIIGLLPISFKMMGATKTLAVLIAAQLLGAALWDLTIRGDSPSFQRWMGAFITFVGAWVTVMAR